MLVTTFRPDLDYPQLVAYVGWFDHTRTAIGYYPGRYEPPHAAVRGPMMVPDGQRWRLLATFNGGFTYADGHNGSTDNGRMNEPLKDGNATLVGYRDGRIEIVKWSGGPNAGPDVAWARQSLAPIVWNGRLNPALNDNPNSPQWGYTLGGVTRVWRTGVGIDRRGNLIYVAADGQTVISFAKILQHVGAVRAMEFDINPEWHTLITYSHQPRARPDAWSGPTRCSRPPATSSPTTVTSSPSTSDRPVRSPSPSGRDSPARRPRGHQMSSSIVPSRLSQRGPGSSCGCSSAPQCAPPWAHVAKVLSRRRRWTSGTIQPPPMLTDDLCQAAPSMTAAITAFSPAWAVGDHQLGPAPSAGLQAAQERGPERAVLGIAHGGPQDLTASHTCSWARRTARPASVVPANGTGSRVVSQAVVVATGVSADSRPHTMALFTP